MFYIAPQANYKMMLDEFANMETSVYKKMSIMYIRNNIIQQGLLLWESCVQRTEISTALWLSFEYKLQEYSQSKEKKHTNNNGF